MTRRGRHGSFTHCQRGQETLQAILVVGLVLVPMLIAIITFATLVHTSIATQAAAAAGARAASVAGEFGEPELARIADELRTNGIDPTNCSVTPADAHTVQLDERIPVTVSCPEAVGIPFFWSTHANVSSTVVGRGEVNR